MQLHGDDIDASSLPKAVASFAEIGRISAEHPMKAAQISDELFLTFSQQGIAAITYNTFRDFKPIDADAYRLTDVGIKAAIFQRTQKAVLVSLAYLQLSATFCADIFEVREMIIIVRLDMTCFH